MNRFSWWLILHLFVLPLRGRSSGRKYETIWDGTEFAFIRDHRRIAEALEERYRDAGVDAKVEIAMSFGNPSVEHAMRSLMDAGCDRLVVLPLYPQNAYSQARIVADEVARCAEVTGWDGRYCVIGDYSENDAYLDAVAESIKGSGYDPSKDWLLMSFHSIPRSDVERGDAYERNVWRTCHAIARRLGARRDRWAGGFQSRFDREREWVSPFSDDILSEWARKDMDGRLFVVCPNFAVDCLETYYDIDNVMRNRWSALQDGRDRRVPFVYVPCLGTSDAHICVLEAVINAGRHVPVMDSLTMESVT